MTGAEGLLLIAAMAAGVIELFAGPYRKDGSIKSDALRVAPMVGFTAVAAGSLFLRSI
jgi:hypothetical protein